MVPPENNGSYNLTADTKVATFFLFDFFIILLAPLYIILYLSSSQST